ncbi:hypothetical protein TREMEDRAFT_66026 [Tremella mesenterica DSM 1558]|uniref:uncharacterized protein n=1 Tax=Tremella mesenterica (strain ATCC 24925 / CBS 8224 / DSM 1558 / NBRC 9311 / NRRL Y-6157 / RJB 2259-6 / UBC 559-6) TaxID=578456 RepID=UPI00032C8990|nr:uncharacterized protein TREMEDRAFT_66026 [Tremella mesenterica DSM 1558]EIW65937.1 hypothetical protein TREMEDRAFT_66026 [Tremella mesenterica DSM 1558]
MQSSLDTEKDKEANPNSSSNRKSPSVLDAISEKTDSDVCPMDLESDNLTDHDDEGMDSFPQKDVIENNIMNDSSDNEREGGPATDLAEDIPASTINPIATTSTDDRIIRTLQRNSVQREILKKKMRSEDGDYGDVVYVEYWKFNTYPEYLRNGGKGEGMGRNIWGQITIVGIQKKKTRTIGPDDYGSNLTIEQREFWIVEPRVL